MENLMKHLKNTRHTLYKVCDVVRRPMPRWFAGWLRSGNGVPAPGVLTVETCDGSNQAVHPSVTNFQGKTWLALTPYPYGMEFYENPCLYVRDGGDFAPIPGMTPVIQAQNMGKEHYSDPVLTAWEDKLTLIYRRCDRRPEGKIDQLFWMESADGIHWTAPILLAEALGDQLISPAVDAKEKNLFCVEADPAVDSQVVYYHCRDGQLGEKHGCEVCGLPEGWFVWHMDVKHFRDGTLHGLFMLRKKHTRQIISRLALFTWDGACWRWDRDVVWTPEEAKHIQFVYKSTFAEEGKLLCSACDVKNRYYLFYKEI